MKNKNPSIKKKLLVLTSTFPRWDGDHEPPFVFELCRHLSRQFEVLVLAPHTRGARIQEQFGDVRVYRYRYFIEKWEVLAYQGGILANLKRHSGSYLLVPLLLIAQAIAALHILRREKIDVIHAHWLIPQGLASFICGLALGRKFPALLCTSHGSDLLGLRGPLFSFLKRLILRRASAVTVVSDSMKEAALELGARKKVLHTIPMGIDARHLFLPSTTIKRATVELLFVGRLVTSKAADSLIHAMPIILKKHPAAILSIVGDGPDKARLASLVKLAGIEKHVHFLGPLKNSKLPPFYQRAAIFLAPSLSEGFGLTLIEALACECPVIASDLPAFHDIISDGTTGIFVPPGDIQAIADKTVYLLDNPEARKSLGCAGREAVLEKFDWDVVSKKYVDLLESLSPPISACDD